ncbi:MAG: phage major capsid protein, partial [Paraclostridium sp.]
RAREMGTEEKLVEKRSAEELEERALDNFFRGNELSKEERAMLTTQSGNQATIPVTIAKGILKRLEEMCPILEKAKRFKSKGTLRLINETSYGSAGVTAEGVEFVYDDATLDFIELSSHKVTAQTKISFELLANSEVDMNQYLTEVILRRLATEVSKYLVAGTGVKQPSGVINGTQVCTVTEELGIKDFIMMQTTCNPAYLDKAFWLCNRQTFQHIASLMDNMGRPYLTSHVINEKIQYRLLGLEVVVDMHMPAMGAGARPVVLCNAQEGYSVNMLQDVVLRHLTEIGFTEGTETFAGYLMLDGKITNQDAIVVGQVGATVLKAKK